MRTPEKPSIASLGPRGSAEQPEDPGPPEPPSPTSLTDGRARAEFGSVYSWGAWIQIAVEFTYLVLIVLGTLFGLLLIVRITAVDSSSNPIEGLIGPYPENRPLLLWIIVGLAGACGGATMSLKWLYHSIAKQIWHHDRLVWRIVVPILSAVLAIFTGMMITSGIVPFFSNSALNNPIGCAGFGFFIGMFSDNLLASLQRLALQVFGTIDHPHPKPGGRSDKKGANTDSTH